MSEQNPPSGAGLTIFDYIGLGFILSPCEIWATAIMRGEQLDLKHAMYGIPFLFVGAAFIYISKHWHQIIQKKTFWAEFVQWGVIVSQKRHVIFVMLVSLLCLATLLPVLILPPTSNEGIKLQFVAGSPPTPSDAVPSKVKTNPVDIPKKLTILDDISEILQTKMPDEIGLAKSVFSNWQNNADGLRKLKSSYTEIHEGLFNYSAKYPYYEDIRQCLAKLVWGNLLNPLDKNIAIADFLSSNRSPVNAGALSVLTSTDNNNLLTGIGELESGADEALKCVISLRTELTKEANGAQ